MSCKLTGDELCGHKVCEDDYEGELPCEVCNHDCQDEQMTFQDGLYKCEACASNKGDNMTITQTNNRYVVDLADGRLHILNRKALIWNLKHVFGIVGEQGKAVMKQLDATGKAELTLAKAA